LHDAVEVLGASHIGAHDDELVASESRDGVDLTTCLTQFVGDVAQQVVAHFVA
jgi:hypothetical protein